MDNYSYILTDSDTNISAIIDPSEAEPIIKKCEDLDIKPQYIINTHHHFDHTDGNLEISEKYDAQIVCNEIDKHRIKGCKIFINDNSSFVLGNSVAKIIDVSAHTKGHIAIYFEKDKALFTGDTLFNLCIGGLFEGTPEQMFRALSKIKSIPDDVMFYPGHEYTFSAANFAYQYNQGNDNIIKYLTKAKTNLDTTGHVFPITLGEEKLCNPYLQAKTLEDFTNL
jgi:hydroxyacylglutathione hydrolase